MGLQLVGLVEPNATAPRHAATQSPSATGRCASPRWLGPWRSPPSGQSHAKAPKAVITLVNVTRVPSAEQCLVLGQPPWGFGVSRRDTESGLFKAAKQMAAKATRKVATSGRCGTPRTVAPGCLVS